MNKHRMPSILAAGLAFVAGAACSWTEFDEIEKETWVTSTEKPNGDSADYGVAIQRGSLTSDSGGKVVVIGAGQAQYTELLYSRSGAADLAPTALKLNSQFGVGNLDPQPILIANPTNDEVALFANTGSDNIAALIGAGDLKATQIYGPTSADAATYMDPPVRLDMPALEHPIQPLVAQGDSVWGAFVVGRPSMPLNPRCQLQDSTGTPVTIRGLGAAPLAQTTHDDLVVWTATGKLILYPGGVFNGQDPFGPCTGGVHGPLAGSVEVDTGYLPGIGSQILMLEGRYAVLVGHKEPGNTDSYLGVFDVTAMNATPALEPAMIGTPVTQADLRTAAILSLGPSDHYVVAGYPTSSFDGVQAGRVLVFALDLTTGLDSTPAMTLHDAQPESNQVFGRGVAVTPYNGRPVIAVAADNEVFLYFRTTLYDETRDRQ